MKYVSSLELRLFYLLIGISIYQFSSAYQVFFSVTEIPGLPLWVLLTSLLPVLFFPRSLIFSLFFLFMFCLYEYPVSSELQGYSTNLVPIFMGYFILCNNVSGKKISKFALYGIVSSLYFFSSLSKIFFAPDFWLNGEVVQKLFQSFNYNISHQLALALSLSVIIAELSVILVFIKPRWMGYFVFALIFFHGLNFKLFQINFFYFLLPCLLLCIPWKFPKLR